MGRFDPVKNCSKDCLDFALHDFAPFPYVGMGMVGVYNSLMLHHDGTEVPRALVGFIVTPVNTRL